MACCAARPSGASRPRPRAAAVAAAQEREEEDDSAGVGRRKPVQNFSYPHTTVAPKAQLQARESQDRRKVEAKQAAAMRGSSAQSLSQQSRLDMSVGAWLEAQNEALPIFRTGSPKECALADVLRTELHVSTLRDLMGAIHHPTDWASVIPADPDRCQRLWLALLREIDVAKAATPEHQTEAVPAWFETLRYAAFSLFAVPAAPASQLTLLRFRLTLIFAVFLLLRYMWDKATAQTPRQIHFTDPEAIHPSALRQFHGA
eukprot:COSAG02_NODE_6058_length_3835_cov_4.573876_1_plen_259_part_00